MRMGMIMMMMMVIVAMMMMMMMAEKAPSAKRAEYVGQSEKHSGHEMLYPA